MGTSSHFPTKALLGQGDMNMRGMVPGSLTSQVTQRTYDLNDSDDRYALIFRSPVTADLTKILVGVDSYNGTWGNTDGDINYEIFAGMGGAHIPTTPLVYSGTITPDGSSTDSWQASGVLAHALTKGQLYFVAIHDADGGVTDYITMHRDIKISTTYAPTMSSGAYTANAWSTGTSTGFQVPMVLTIGDWLVAGAVMVANQTVPTSTLQRGVEFTPNDNCTIVGIIHDGLNATNALLEGATITLYADGVNPGGVSLKTWTFPTYIGSAGSTTSEHTSFIDDTYDLIAGVTYRFVTAPNTNNTMAWLETFDDLDADVRTLLAGDMSCVAIIDNGAGGWTRDTDVVARYQPLLTFQTTGRGRII